MMLLFYVNCDEDFGILVELRLLENICFIMDIIDDGLVLLVVILGLFCVFFGEDFFLQWEDVNIDLLIGVVSLLGIYVGFVI